MHQLSIKLVAVSAVCIAFSVVADDDPTYVLSVHDLSHKAEQLSDQKVAIRGYLMWRANGSLYATKEQALLDDLSFISVSDGDKGGVSQNCSENYVEIVARVSYTHPIDWALIPIEVSILSLNESKPPSKRLCWSRNGQL